MAKKRSELSAPVKQAGKSAKHISGGQIDFSDIPESTDDELKQARRVGRPRSNEPKKLIAIRISPKLLGRLRRLAAKQRKPYQTLIHELLEKLSKDAA